MKTDEPMQLLGFSTIEDGQFNMKVELEQKKINIPLQDEAFEFRNPKFFNQ